MIQILTQMSQKLDKGLISKLIAKTGNAHNNGELLILPSVSIIISDVMNLSVKEPIQAIPLSNSTVAKRMDEIAYDTEETLVSSVRSKKFSLRLDENSNLVDSNQAIVSFLEKSKTIGTI